MQALVTKQSIRNLIGSKRLPRRFRMFVAGSWLYDVLKANRLHNEIHLGQMSYWVYCLSLNSKSIRLNWKEL
jgi:hypothetical protein